MKTLHFTPSAPATAGRTLLASPIPSQVLTQCSLGAKEQAVQPDGDAKKAASPRAAGEFGGQRTVLPSVAEHNGQVSVTPRQQPRYARLRALGAGGMGEVDLAEDHDIGRSVAIKRLPEGSNTPLAVARFVGEVRTMGKLDHPNIAPIYDVGCDERGRYFFAMKFIEGESLESLIDRLAAGDPTAHAEYPVARRLDIFAGIVHALGYAHARDVLHHDIKPANVMLGRHGEVHLVDWGIARSGGDGPNRGVEGTPLYMSPEQANGEETDPRTDLYSAFVVLFELLTLRSYLQRDNSELAIMREVLEGEVPGTNSTCWIHPHQAATPVELRHFVRKGLHRDREQRFTNAEEAMASLERLRSGEIAVQCPVTALKAQQARLSKLADRQPHGLMVALGFGLAGFVAVLFLAGLGLTNLIG